VLPIRSLGFAGTFGNELIFAMSVPRGRTFPLARALGMCVRERVRGAEGHGVEMCGHNRRRVISDPSVNTRLVPQGQPHPPSSPSQTALRMHAGVVDARERESESCYDMRADQIAPCVLCVPDDCTDCPKSDFSALVVRPSPPSPPLFLGRLSTRSFDAEEREREFSGTPRALKARLLFDRNATRRVPAARETLFHGLQF